MSKCKIWTLKAGFQGQAKRSDFQLVEGDLPTHLNDGELVCEALYLSVDPYMRLFSDWSKVGEPIVGEQVARVTASKNAKYPVGTTIRLSSGWRSHTHVRDVSTIDVMPELGDLPLSLTLGVMGMPGMTAYFTLVDVLKLRKGETLLVSGAAGAVGSLAGQIGKIIGCTVIGVAGSDAKVQWLKELGFDHAFNYKTEDIGKSIEKVAPEGVHCYCDMVGGEISFQAIKRMRNHGRMVVLGSISTYNTTNPTGPYLFTDILTKSLTITGFIIFNIREKWHIGEKQMAEWIKQGKLKYRETITDGFEHMPEAFLGLFEGKNTGKAVVKA
ncbi:prostaglandin reductase 1-like [Mizuhopecten yessoensis]|uniref:Prostaglandin reductase 1 n=1 Tax=Mizuhopecten yessoensis TaxID=6573 RepID=A0A210PM28_MIZYE|nr:prostaglandin reductase 1-like [Mizuhopecten yessoensis]OWF37552.1 Prostaglandin reductase 1 [Mizuhopecten yessoensis]